MYEEAKHWCILFFFGGVEIFNRFVLPPSLSKYRFSCANWKVNFKNFLMSTGTSIFCEITWENKPVKNSTPLKIVQNFCLLTHLYPLLPGLYIIQEITLNIEKHILSNGPHLVSPQQAQKVTKTENEVTVEPYFWSLIDYHPVLYMYKEDLNHPVGLTFLTPV